MNLHEQLLAATEITSPIGFLVGSDPQQWHRPESVEIVWAPDAVTPAKIAAGLRAVVELHAPREGWFIDKYTECGGCDPSPHSQSQADWPCSTILAVASALGCGDTRMSERRWHVVYREEFDAAEARAIGAFAGYMSARGEDFMVTAVFQSAFRRAVSEAFNAGADLACGLGVETDG